MAKPLMMACVAAAVIAAAGLVAAAKLNRPFAPAPAPSGQTMRITVTTPKPAPPVLGPKLETLPPGTEDAAAPPRPEAPTPVAPPSTARAPAEDPPLGFARRAAPPPEPDTEDFGDDRQAAREALREWREEQARRAEARAGRLAEWEAEEEDDRQRRYGPRGADPSELPGWRYSRPGD